MWFLQDGASYHNFCKIVTILRDVYPGPVISRFVEQNFYHYLPIEHVWTFFFGVFSCLKFTPTSSRPVKYSRLLSKAISSRYFYAKPLLKISTEVYPCAINALAVI